MAGAQRSDQERHRNRPVIALDGTESVHGRALFAVSALYWCVDWLPEVEVRLIDALDDDVILAASILRAETGADLRIQPSFSKFSTLAGADIYVAAAFRSGDHLRLAEARHWRIPVMLALQFPDPEYLSGSVLRQRAAFDPKVFAEHLYTIVGPWL
jgi:hypothetical protein